MSLQRLSVAPPSLYKKTLYAKFGPGPKFEGPFEIQNAPEPDFRRLWKVRSAEKIDLRFEKWRLCLLNIKKHDWFLQNRGSRIRQNARAHAAQMIFEFS